MNSVPTVEVQRVLDDRSRHGRWPITKNCGRIIRSCAIVQRSYLFFPLDGLGPRRGLFLRLKPAKQRPPPGARTALPVLRMLTLTRTFWDNSAL